MGTRYLEALGVCAGRGDVALFGGWNGHVQRCGVASDLALEHAGEGGRHAGGLGS